MVVSLRLLGDKVWFFDFGYGTLRLGKTDGFGFPAQYVRSLRLFVGCLLMYKFMVEALVL